MLRSWHFKYALVMSGLFAITVGYNACSEDAGFELNQGFDSLEEFNNPPSQVESADPVPTVVINNDAEYTREQEVNLTLNPDGPADQMLISNAPDCSTGQWEDYQQNKIWNLFVTNQKAYVYVKYKFEDQPETACVKDEIVHDDIPPVISFVQGVGSVWLNESNVNISFQVTDSGSGVQESQCDNNGSGLFKVCGNSIYYSNMVENKNYSLVVQAFDRAGNRAGPDQLNWRPDYTPPTVVFNTAPAAITADTTPDFSFTGTDLGSGIAAYECKLDNGDYLPCSSPRTLSNLADGSHTYSVRATDNVGLVSEPATHTWVQDSTAPTVEFTQTPNAIENSNSATFAFREVAGGIANFLCSIDGAAYVACTSPRVVNNLADGNHNFRVIGVDGVGNQSSPIAYNWLVDTTPPTISLSQHPQAIENSNTARFGFVAQDQGSGVKEIQCRLDGAGYTPCAASMDFNNIAQGTHTLRARSQDNAGNYSTEVSYTWTVDLTGPTVTITSTPNNPTNQAVANFEFTAVDGETSVAVIECRVDGQPFSSCTSPAAFNSLADGQHNFSVRARDQAGNMSNVESYEWLVDTTAPILSFISKPNGVEYVGSTPKVSFTAVDGNGSGVASYTCLYNGTAFACDAQLVYDYPAEQTGNNSFMVTVTDNVGNSATLTTHWAVEYQVQNYTTTKTIEDDLPVDILFVIDNSGSMNPERASLGQKINGLLSQIGNVDWQIAVTSTDLRGNQDHEEGRIADFDGNGLHILDSSMDVNVAQTLFENKLTNRSQSNPNGIPVGSGHEEGIHAMARVVDRSLDGQTPENEPNTQFIRDGAAFVAVVLSDENEASQGNVNSVVYQPQEFLDRFNSQFTDPKTFTFHSIVVVSGDTACLNEGPHPHYYGTLYEELSMLTGFGQPGGATIGSVCANDYTAQLKDIGKSVKDLAKTVSLECTPLDQDNGGLADVVVTYQAVGAQTYEPYNEDYTVQGQQISFDDFLPPGDFRFEYQCVPPQ